MGLAIFALFTEGIFALGALAVIVALFVGLRKHRLIAGGLSLAVAAAYFWSLFPTAWVHDDLCRTKAGEKVYQRVNVSSYYLVLAAGANHDGVGYQSAMQDILDRRAKFVEIMELPDSKQSQSFLGNLASRAGVDVSRAKGFRPWIGTEASSPRAITYSQAVAQAHFYKGRLMEGECIAIASVETPTSPYGVALFVRRPVWFTSEITEFGIRVFDAKEDRTLGEYSAYEQLPRPLVLLAMNSRPFRCPKRRTSLDLPMQLMARNVLLNPK